jgi:hypothetical protein
MKVTPHFFLLFISLLAVSCYPSAVGKYPADSKEKVAKEEVDTRYTFPLHQADSITVRLRIDSTRINAISLSTGQTLDLSDTYRPVELIKLEAIDLNFDGYNDLRILNNEGATGNSWYDTWLYNQKTKKLVKNQFLSQNSSLMVDTLGRKILTFYRAGACEESLGVYAVKDTTYTLVEDWSSEPRNEQCIIFRLRIKNKQVLAKDSTLSNLGLLATYKRSALPK